MLPLFSFFAQFDTPSADGSGLVSDDEFECDVSFVKSPWSTPCMIINDFLYNCHSRRKGKAYWRCHNYSKKAVEQRCRARCVIADGKVRAMTGGGHNHGPHTEKIAKIMHRSQLETIGMAQSEQSFEHQQEKPNKMLRRYGPATSDASHSGQHSHLFSSLDEEENSQELTKRGFYMSEVINLD